MVLIGRGHDTTSFQVMLIKMSRCYSFEKSNSILLFCPPFNAAIQLFRWTQRKASSWEILVAHGSLDGCHKLKLTELGSLLPYFVGESPTLKRHHSIFYWSCLNYLDQHFTLFRNTDFVSDFNFSVTILFLPPASRGTGSNRIDPDSVYYWWNCHCSKT